MITKIQDVLSDTLIIFGLVLLIAVIFYVFLYVLSKIERCAKYIIMYQTYKKDKTLYDLKDKLILDKNGSISQTCITDIDEQIRIMEKGIANCKDLQKLVNDFQKENTNASHSN